VSEFELRVKTSLIRTLVNPWCIRRGARVGVRIWCTRVCACSRVHPWTCAQIEINCTLLSCGRWLLWNQVFCGNTCIYMYLCIYVYICIYIYTYIHISGEPESTGSACAQTELKTMEKRFTAGAGHSRSRRLSRRRLLTPPTVLYRCPD